MDVSKVNISIKHSTTRAMAAQQGEDRTVHLILQTDHHVTGSLTVLSCARKYLPHICPGNKAVLETFKVEETRITDNPRTPKYNLEMVN